MDRKVKIGVVGLDRGVFVLNAAKVLDDKMVISAVCEINDKKIEEVKHLFAPETKVFKDYDEFLKEDLDGVVLCNYFYEHAAFAIKAMEAGKAVLSETTAAASLGECIDLVEAKERTGGKYMLAANCPYFKPLAGIMAKIESGELGRVVCADAEYVHPSLNPPTKLPDLDNLHWRQTLPPCYYNMHTLGPLMYITNSVPKKVIGKAPSIPTPTWLNDTPRTLTITEMDNGAVFNTTGAVRVGTHGKWYRVIFEDGTMETERFDYVYDKLITMGKNVHSTGISYPDWPWGDLTDEEKKKYLEGLTAIGHGGIDFFVVMDFIRYVRDDKEPFFDIYRSMALSAAGILSWYSMLNSSREYDIPDFKDKEAREIFRGDYRMPFAKRYKDLTLPCRISPFEVTKDGE